MVTTAPMLAANPQRRLKFWNSSRTAYSMILPGSALIAAFILAPFIFSIWLSFHSEVVGAPIPMQYKGWFFYKYIFEDPIYRSVFLRSLENNGIFALVVVPTQTAVALFLAMLVNRAGKFAKFCRTAFFLPVVFPMALTAMVWSAILSPGPTSLMNGILHTLSFGLIGPQQWFGQSLAMFSIIMLSIWQGAGFQMVIFLAGLQGIPQSHYEAAMMDGASKWRQFLDVTLPGLRNTTIFVVIVTTIFSLRVFDQIYLITRGGPSNATTTIMFQAVSQAYESNNVGLGAAISVIMCILIALVSIVQRQTLKVRTYG